MKVPLPSVLAVVVCALGARGVVAAQKGAKLDGLYRAFPAVAEFGAAVGEAYVFSPGGDVHRGWPGARSVAPFDFARAKREAPGDTGKYAVAGDRITFRWSDGKSESAAFNMRRDPKTGRTILSIGPNYAYRIIPLKGTPKGTLNGAFEPSTYQGGFDNARTVGDRITFRPDGGFTTEGEDAAKGRYKIEGATLTLTTSGGERRTYTLHVFAEGKEAPATVLIDGRPFNAAKG